MEYAACHHVKTNGTICQSPALENKQLCFFHHRDHQRRLRIDNALAHKRSTLSRWGTPDGLCQSPAMATPFDDHAAALLHALDLPLLEDALAVNVAITNIMRALATQQISNRTAGLLLYSLQIAASNLKNVQPATTEQTANLATETDRANDLPSSEFDPLANIRAMADTQFPTVTPNVGAPGSRSVPGDFADVEGEVVGGTEDLVPHVREANVGTGNVSSPNHSTKLLDDLVALGNTLIRDQTSTVPRRRGGRNKQLARAELIFGKAARDGHAMRALLDRLESASKNRSATAPAVQDPPA